jgi:hypothetical protein
MVFKRFLKICLPHFNVHFDRRVAVTSQSLYAITVRRIEESSLFPGRGKGFLASQNIRTSFWSRNRFHLKDMEDSSMESCQAVKLAIQIHLSAEVKRVRGVFKKREIFKYRANKHRERATATERT